MKINNIGIMFTINNIGISDLAYIAGIIDSDGSLILSYNKRGNGRVRRYFINIEMLDGKVIPHIALLLSMKDKVKILTRNNRLGYISHNLKITSPSEIKKILTSLYFYLFTKQHRAKLILNAINIKEKVKLFYSESESKSWDNYCTELKFLNHNYSKDDKLRNHKFHWAWLAGIIDGDGSIMISKFINTTKMITYKPTVEISMHHKTTMEYISFILKTNYRKRKTGAYTIRLMSIKLMEILPKVIPYLVFKKELAILAVDIAKLRSSVPNGCTKHKNYDIANRKIKELKRLNSDKYNLLKHIGE